MTHLVSFSHLSQLALQFKHFPLLKNFPVTQPGEHFVDSNKYPSTHPLQELISEAVQSEQAESQLSQVLVVLLAKVADGHLSMH